MDDPDRDISSLYDRRFFARQLPWHQEYRLVADTLARHLLFSTVLDVGCGSGFIIAHLASSHGKAVTGVDGSTAAHTFAPDAARERILVRDLTIPLDIGRHDLVICTEVAEHLPAPFADTLVGSICRNAGNLVFFTAAQPGQGGYDHVNERPHEYWINKFRGRGYELDVARTVDLRRELSRSIRVIRWFPRNALLFAAMDAEKGAD